MVKTATGEFWESTSQPITEVSVGASGEHIPLAL
jgi:hypothetical protein